MEEVKAGIRVDLRIPTVEEHRGIAEAVGWGSAFDWPSMLKSLEHSLFGVVILDGENAVGMGRVVGDGVKYFYIQDVAVLPEYQRHGFGQVIVDRLLEDVRTVAPAPAFIGLFATEAAQDLYRRNGFSGTSLTGMFCVMDSRS